MYIQVLDAADFSKGPVAKLWLNHHVPHGLHGFFSPKYYGPSTWYGSFWQSFLLHASSFPAPSFSADLISATSNRKSLCIAIWGLHAQRLHEDDIPSAQRLSSINPFLEAFLLGRHVCRHGEKAGPVYTGFSMYVTILEDSSAHSVFFAYPVLRTGVDDC